MDSQFWIKVWTEGRTHFHQEKVHEKLVEYLPRLNPSAGQRVLVPLCGKSKDLLWLRGMELKVHGVELHDQAVESFFLENQLSPVSKSKDGVFVRYAHGDLIVSCGDFFELGEDGVYDLVYDRAALVALPAPMRRIYSQVVTRALKKGGKCLLFVYEYDQKKMEGPPFSISSEEIRALYGAQFDIQLLENGQPGKEGVRVLSVDGIRHDVYLLEKTR